MTDEPRGPAWGERVQRMATMPGAITPMPTVARATESDDGDGWGLSKACVQQQAEYDRLLLGSTPAVVRALLRFIARPTADDIMDAIKYSFFIVVRVHIPERWLNEFTSAEGCVKTMRRCQAILAELGIEGGHARVFLVIDNCGNEAQFQREVYGRFGA